MHYRTIVEDVLGAQGKTIGKELYDGLGAYVPQFRLVEQLNVRFTYVSRSNYPGLHVRWPDGHGAFIHPYRTSALYYEEWIYMVLAQLLLVPEMFRGNNPGGILIHGIGRCYMTDLPAAYGRSEYKAAQ